MQRAGTTTTTNATAAATTVAAIPTPTPQPHYQFMALVEGPLKTLLQQSSTTVWAVPVHLGVLAGVDHLITNNTCKEFDEGHRLLSEPSELDSKYAHHHYGIIPDFKVPRPLARVTLLVGHRHGHVTATRRTPRRGPLPPRSRHGCTHPPTTLFITMTNTYTHIYICVCV